MASWIWRRNWGGSLLHPATSAGGAREEENDRAGDESDDDILSRRDVAWITQSQLRLDTDDGAIRTTLRRRANRVPILDA
eukprot:CAMPEP_0194332012 /NCGR_PEP_ID=MMETSP0171-20130528/57693_1 /TAXON_ID=218684 /ORGANISM="Corethron pennatum, Strain L29A3" /LENGTH=79 /DNA_ID=CAMNT_0039093703 /DNA_START=466 /DNA_END=701 /DNA_ORIENTATION=-